MYYPSELEPREEPNPEVAGIDKKPTESIPAVAAPTTGIGAGAECETKDGESQGRELVCRPTEIDLSEDDQADYDREEEEQSPVSETNNDAAVIERKEPGIDIEARMLQPRLVKMIPMCKLQPRK